MAREWHFKVVFSHMVVCVCLAKAEGGEESATVAKWPSFSGKLETSKLILDSRFFFRWNLDSSSIFSGIPDSYSRIKGIPKPRIPDSTSKNFLDSGI